MTSQTYPYPFPLVRVLALLGLFFAYFMILGAEAFAVPTHSSPEGPTLDLQSGIVGLALHLTARHVGDPAKLIIRAVHPSGPAAQAGLTHGEEIYSVNGASLIGKTYQEVIMVIRGKIGSRVQLGLRGPQGERTVTLLRVSENILMEHIPQTM